MHGNLSAAGIAAIKATAASGSESFSTVASDSDDGDWFAKAAWSLLGKDAGHALSLETGLPEGSCYKYAAKDAAARRKPPGYLIRTLLRSEHGASWLAAIMEGSDAGWWQRHLRNASVADAARQFAKSL